MAGGPEQEDPGSGKTGRQEGPKDTAVEHGAGEKQEMGGVDKGTVSSLQGQGPELTTSWTAEEA